MKVTALCIGMLPSGLGPGKDANTTKVEVGDEFKVRVKAIAGKDRPANRHVEYTPNGLSASFECKGTTLDYSCNLIV